MSHQKWEYHTLKFKADGGFLRGKLDETALDNELNRLGGEG